MALILVDADSIYFRASYKLKKNEVRKQIDATMADIRNQCAAHFFEIDLAEYVAVKGKGNFRKDLYPDYKGNRKRDYEEAHRAALNYGHEYMVDKYNAVQADGMEADDLVCIWAHEAMAADQEFVIAGIDKDLKQIPGVHYNFNKQIIEEVDEDAAHLSLMLQSLTGDTGDNIPGIKGIGPAKARKILDGVSKDRRWSRVRAAWRAHGAGDPSLSYRLLAMLKSFEEFEDVKAQVASQAAISEQDVPSEQVEDSGVHSVSGGD